MSILQWGTVGIQSYGANNASKMDLLVQISIPLFKKNRMVNRIAIFLNLVFLVTLPKKNDRQDLKMGCIDASRR
jgi:hypothetical protein